MTAFGTLRAGGHAKTTLSPASRAHRAAEHAAAREMAAGEPAPDLLDHLDLSRRRPDGARDEAMAGITHVIWPEAAMPFLPLQSPEALAAIGEMLPAGSASDLGRLCAP